ncbi:N-acetyltransferase family protein [Siminovitchia sp. 179-K 8D1 HS]|uniref:N-acetyltransferase family protein n=1 Tax=Siminovitchia sp. 179-K 8D1 HS TaxID=3142385 RepID=UPI0039A3E2B7
MIEVKALSECPLTDAAEAWNKGFSDYYSNLRMPVDQLAFRFGNDQISPRFSFVAYDDGQPVGVILNAIQTFNGTKWAWNGGTSVSPLHRGQGIGKKLMEATMEIYRKEDVERASLEAFSVNENAIRLYESFGYETVDRLLFLKSTDTFLMEEKNEYLLENGLAKRAACLPFYQEQVPWQTRWNFIRQGEAVIAKNRDGEPVGYALYQKRNTEDGSLAAVTLFQCIAAENQSDREGILKSMLANVFSGEKSYPRVVYNLPKSNELLIRILKSSGFKEMYTDSGTLLEQVFMICHPK